MWNTQVCAHTSTYKITQAFCVKEFQGTHLRYRQTWILPGGVEKTELKRVLILLFHFIAVVLPLLLALSSDRKWYKSFHRKWRPKLTLCICPGVEALCASTSTALFRAGVQRGDFFSLHVFNLSFPRQPVGTAEHNWGNSQLWHRYSKHTPLYKPSMQQHKGTLCYPPQNPETTAESTGPNYLNKMSKHSIKTGLCNQEKDS